MPRGMLVSDPNLEVLTIKDFTAGVVNGAHNGPTYSSEAPVGSASSAFRCYARKDIGLKPFPTYTTVFTETLATTGNVQPGQFNFLTVGAMVLQPGYFPGVAINYTLSGFNANIGGVAAPSFKIQTQLFTGAAYVPLNQYASTGPQSYGSNNFWTGLSPGFWIQARTTQGVFTIDPLSNSPGTWVVTPNPAAVGPNLTGAIPAGGNTNAIRPMFIGGRMVFCAPYAGGATLGGVFDDFVTSDPFSATNLVGNEFFLPERLGLVGAYGTISTGEYLLVGQAGNAVVVTGDFQNPSSAIWLPGVAGTGSAMGPATPTPQGLIYVTDYDGAWIWNGGNTSQKISGQIVDTVLLRNDAPGQFQQPSGQGLNVSNACWMNWAMFANNWFFDVSTGSWWQCEDPAVNVFQVHGGMGATTQVFFSTPGTVVSQGAGTLTLPFMRWDHSTPSSSYRWISNPLPFPGGLVSLQAIEICASNTTNTPCTIRVTPTAPPKQSAFGNQTNQFVEFTIPPNTASYRASQSLGFTDYNVCVQVDASNDSSANGAPVLHEISCGIDRRVSGISGG